MRLIVLVLLATISFAVPPARAAQIANDNGGHIGTYVERFNRLRDSGERVVVDGQCLSACTLLLAIVPRDRICVTQNAAFGFHAAWSPASTGDVAANPAATRLLWNMYPQRVRTWLRANGGLNGTMIYLRGRELAALYPACSPDTERRGVAVAAYGRAQATPARQAGRTVARARSIRGFERSSGASAAGWRADPYTWR